MSWCTRSRTGGVGCVVPETHSRGSMPPGTDASKTRHNNNQRKSSPHPNSRRGAGPARCTLAFRSASATTSTVPVQLYLLLVASTVHVLVQLYMSSQQVISEHRADENAAQNVARAISSHPQARRAPHQPSGCWVAASASACCSSPCAHAPQIEAGAHPTLATRGC